MLSSLSSLGTSFLFLDLWDRVLFSPGWLQTQNVVKDDFELPILLSLTETVGMDHHVWHSTTKREMSPARERPFSVFLPVALLSVSFLSHSFQSTHIPWDLVVWQGQHWINTIRTLSHGGPGDVALQNAFLAFKESSDSQHPTMWRCMQEHQEFKVIIHWLRGKFINPISKNRTITETPVTCQLSF